MQSFKIPRLLLSLYSSISHKYLSWPIIARLSTTQWSSHRVHEKYTYTDNNNNNDNGDKSALIIHTETRLNLHLEDDKAYEDENKFGLANIHDIKKVFHLLKHANYKYKLNDMTCFLKRIAELNERNILHLNPESNPELGILISKIKSNLMEATQDYPLIGSIAYCFCKLNYSEDKELWLTLGDYIIDDRFYSNFKEIVYAIEGFTILKTIAEKDFFDSVYEKLENLVSMTIKQINIKYSTKIIENLIKVQRYNPCVFNKLEYHIINNLPQDNEYYTLLKILFSFAISENGSFRFYNLMQTALYKDLTMSMTNHTELHMVYQSELIGKLCEIYHKAKKKFPNFEIDMKIKDIVNKLIMNENTVYELKYLIQILKHIEVFQFTNISDIDIILESKLYNIKDNIQIEDIIYYLDIKAIRNHEGDYTKIPSTILNYFDEYIKNNLMVQDPHKLYNYINYIELKGLLYNRDEFLNKMVDYVSHHLLNYDFEQMCYYYWLFNKYHFLIKLNQKSTCIQMNMIKDNIRLGSAFSKGHLAIGSNFYKMLEVVNGSDFLSEGQYPTW